jgi:hypothetical protein
VWLLVKNGFERPDGATTGCIGVAETTLSDVQEGPAPTRSFGVYPAEEDGVTPMRLLQSGIPLSLLLDLVLGPHSDELMAHEASAADGALVRRSQTRRHRPHRAIGTV